ncbi:MAG: hypothetical protein HC837_06985 [Chloroflexaceae bacterium]|nr:hypothetical protein [Chloroflexaceae bacterium]
MHIYLTAIDSGMSMHVLIMLVVITLWFVLTIITLAYLRVRSMPDLRHIQWALIILLVPLLGSLAFWLIRPGLPGKDVITPEYEGYLVLIDRTIRHPLAFSGYHERFMREADLYQ